MRGGDIGFGRDERDAIAVVTHDVVAQHRLIGVDQSVAVVRHVFRGEHGHDAGHGRAPPTYRSRGCARVRAGRTPFSGAACPASIRSAG